MKKRTTKLFNAAAILSACVVAGGAGTVTQAAECSDALAGAVDMVSENDPATESGNTVLENSEEGEIQTESETKTDDIQSVIVEIPVPEKQDSLNTGEKETPSNKTEEIQKNSEKGEEAGKKKDKSTKGKKAQKGKKDTGKSAKEKKDTSKSAKESPEKEVKKESKGAKSAEKRIEKSEKKVIQRNINYADMSGEFSVPEERTKYDESCVLEGIPAFITEDMIIGAIKCQDETGYPASVTIAQIINESGYGRYGDGGENHMGLSYLAYEYKNLFGIKGVGPAGCADMKTKEQSGSGKVYSTSAGFRIYNSYEECIEDRADILSRVYKDLIEGVTDANTFARKIGTRWATSWAYSEHLVSTMKIYDLYRLDNLTLIDYSTPEKEESEEDKLKIPCSFLENDQWYDTFYKSYAPDITMEFQTSVIPVYVAQNNVASEGVQCANCPLRHQNTNGN